jgi:hypothetical protein
LGCAAPNCPETVLARAGLIKAATYTRPGALSIHGDGDNYSFTMTPMPPMPPMDLPGANMAWRSSLAGGVIVKVDEAKVTSPRSIPSAVRSLGTRRTFPVVLIHKQQETTVTVTLEERHGLRQSRPAGARGVLLKEEVCKDPARPQRRPGDLRKIFQAHRLLKKPSGRFAQLR